MMTYTIRCILKTKLIDFVTNSYLADLIAAY
jgi:hypothetical protein